MYTEYIVPNRLLNSSIAEYEPAGGDYRPTWLVRTSDWKRVSGTEATNGYHTLSYSWEQSGEKYKHENGEYDLIDNGYHRITVETLEKRKTRRSARCCKKRRSRYVTYDVLLQKICKDFEVEYLWYDKICIDQTNKEEKHRELQQMHLIYSNACYTIALIPEVYIKDNKDFGRAAWEGNFTVAKDLALDQVFQSSWWNRSWTLEELMMSTQILIVGKNAHVWCLDDAKQNVKDIKEDDILSGILLGFKDKELKSVNQPLTHAHFRTSTNQHDKIYALANIFDGIVSIDINYDSDVSDAMRAFYRQLAEHDLSIMCFGAVQVFEYGGPPVLTTTMGSYRLPSWTGVSGMHSLYPIADVVLEPASANYAIDPNMRLHIKCRSYTISSIMEHDDYAAFGGDYERWQRVEENSCRNITSMDDFDQDESSALDWSLWIMHDATCCFATHYWKPTHSAFHHHPVLPLSLTENCEEYIIPALLFNSATPRDTTRGQDGKLEVAHDYSYLLPVLKKSDNGMCKAIGVILVKRFQRNDARNAPEEFLDELFSSLDSTAEEFIIE